MPKKYHYTKKTGRPTDYKPQYCKTLVDYFSTEPIIYKDITITHKDGSSIDKTEAEAAPTPYLTNWLASIDVSHETLRRWVAKYPEFSAAYKKAKLLQREFIIETALKGCHNSIFSIFMLKNVCKWQDREEESWNDKTELEHTGEVSIMGSVKICGKSAEVKIGE